MRSSQLTLFFILALGLNVLSRAQEGVTTVGIQFKPILSSDIINTGPQTNEVRGVSFTIDPKGGYSFGMVVRKGFSRQLSLESGINFTRRNYELNISRDSTNFSGTSDFSYVIYEIPILGMVYVQLGERSFLNTSFGVSLNFLPSDWDSFDTYFRHFSWRQNWLVPGLLANMGYEYRSYDKGFYYIGISYQRPFSRITDARILYAEGNTEVARTAFDINGNYLTLDFRYFFHEDPERKRKKRK